MERRHYSFFRKPDDPKYHSRKECQKPVDPDIKLEDFKCCPQWRRKLSNKWNARILANKLGIPVPDLYWHGPLSELDNIPFESLPECYVLKPTSGWSCIGAFVMKHGVNQFDGKRYSIPELKAAFKKAMSKLPNSYILVEEMVKNEAGEYNIPIDFKCFLFGGKLDSILAIRRKDGHSGWAGIYSDEWKFLGGSKITDRIIHIAPYDNEKIDAPKCLSELVKYAKIMGTFYHGFVRMDFYCTDRGPLLGEITHFSNLSSGITPYAESQLHLWKELEPDLFKPGPVSDDGKIIMAALKKTVGRSGTTKSLGSRVIRSSTRGTNESDDNARRLVVSGRPKKRV